MYPARSEGGRWRAVWHEDRQRRQCEAPTEQKLAIKLEKVTERLEADAPNMRRPGADLIAHYLDPGRLPVQARWSCKHVHTQGRLCAVCAAPVIAAVTCQDIKLGHMQRIVNAAPTAGEGGRGRGMVSALVLSGEHSFGEGLRVSGRERYRSDVFVYRLFQRLVEHGLPRAEVVPDETVSHVRRAATDRSVT